ncbi:MAG TPA: hypothetical protein PKE51_04785 [Gemmatimonadaceae bacterium]|nr:hypothetical protein [Gemmatimonadaceae bacterium]
MARRTSIARSTACRSATVNARHPAISDNVRWHPVHHDLVASRVHTFTHGLGVLVSASAIS